MKRHYDRAIEGLKKNRLSEMAYDIDSYVAYLEHMRAILISQISDENTIGGDLLLQSMGYKPKEKEEEGRR